MFKFWNCGETEVASLSPLNGHRTATFLQCDPLNGFVD